MKRVVSRGLIGFAAFVPTLANAHVGEVADSAAVHTGLHVAEVGIALIVIAGLVRLVRRFKNRS